MSNTGNGEWKFKWSKGKKNVVNNKKKVDGNRLVIGIGSTCNYSLTAKYLN